MFWNTRNVRRNLTPAQTHAAPSMGQPQQPQQPQQSSFIPENVGKGLAAQPPTLPAGFTPQGLGFFGALLGSALPTAVSRPAIHEGPSPQVGSQLFDQMRTAIANRLMQNGFGAMLGMGGTGIPLGWNVLPGFMSMQMTPPYFRNFEMPYRRRPIPDLFID